jgi:hypothetical protein
MNNNRRGRLTSYGTHASGDFKKKGLKRPMKALMMHSAFAMREDGFPLGLLDQKLYNRKTRRKAHIQKKLPIHKKDSYRWLEAADRVAKLIPKERTVVHICDREADFFEFFHAVQERKDFFLVRAEGDKIIGERKRKDNEYLWNYLEGQPIDGAIEVEVPKKGQDPARVARCEIRFGKIILPAPFPWAKVGAKNLKNLDVFAVWVKEIDTPKGAEGLEWMLLTNLSISSLVEALEKVNWYSLRFQIETYHKILKSGCRIEENRFDEAESLKKCLTLKSIVAFRLFQLTWEGRVNPAKLCSEVLTTSEWKALYCYTHKVTRAPEQPPTVREAILWIAKLGGFLARKGDGQPGSTVIWRGWEELTRITRMFEIFQNEKPTWSEATCG